nr:hypothetical protein [Mycobacterium uberis]
MDDPHRVVAIALEMQHHVDEVFKRAWSGDGPVSGDMSDYNQRNIVGLGDGQCGRYGMHLRNTADEAISLGGVHGFVQS